MKVRSFVITGAAIAALAAPAAQAATKPRIAAGGHGTSAAHKPLARSSVPATVAVVVLPATGTPSANNANDASFSDSYFDPITIDTSALQTPLPAVSFPTVTEQDGYLVQ